MEYFKNRLKSFKTLQSIHGISPILFAHAGFHYSSDGEIKCFACKHSLYHLEDLSEPFFEHLFQTHHDCPYLLRTIGNLTPFAMVLHSYFTMDTFEGKDCFHNISQSTNYKYFYDRYITFRYFAKNLQIPTLTLAHLGFYYIPETGEVKCHSCNYTTRKFQDLKQVLTEHMSKKCFYVKSVFGEDTKNINILNCCGMHKHV